MVNNILDIEVNIYTDGACRGNPGPGGWGALLVYGKNKKKIQGFSKNTTNYCKLLPVSADYC